MWSKWIRVELTRGVPSPAWEKKTRPLGKNNVLDMDPCFGGACDP